MLDIGGWEFLLVAFVLVMVVGPKELPTMLRSFTKLTRQMRTVAREFSEGMNQIAVEAEVAEVKAAISKARAGDLEDVAAAIDADGDLGASVKEARDAIRSQATSPEIDEVANLAQESGRELAAAGKENNIATTQTPATSKNKPKTQPKSRPKTRPKSQPKAKANKTPKATSRPGAAKKATKRKAKGG